VSRVATNRAPDAERIAICVSRVHAGDLRCRMRIDQIEDLDVAKQVAQLLEQEIARLHDKLAELTRELARLRGEEGSRQLELELMKLREQSALLEQRLFGRSSEKRSREQEEEAKQKHPGHGPRAQGQLEIVDQHHGLQGVVACPLCGSTVEEWKDQFEDAEEVSVIGRRFVLIRHRRQKGRCRCSATVVTAPGPLKLIPGGRYSIEFAVDVAVAKYLDHLPLNRQAGMMERDGLAMDSQTLWDQIEALARHLRPTYEALREYIVHKPLLHADETPWYLLDGTPAKKWYVWCVAVEDAAYYWIRDSRGAAAGREVLKDYRGWIVVDGYKAYETLAKENLGITLCFCWSHVRRRFLEAERFYPEECKPIIELLGALYAVEREAPRIAGLDGEALGHALRQRAQLRDEKSRAIVAAIHAWALAQHALPESTLRIAIDYMLGLWSGLLHFLEDPRIPLDNNRVERQLRGPVVGRKNHYGSRSKRGTEVAALFYSVLETAKLVGVEPRAYLLHAVRTAIRQPGSSVFPHTLVERLPGVAAAQPAAQTAEPASGA
jgi:transposase